MPTTATTKPATILARRAAVSQGVLARRPYRQIAEELGVSLGTVERDVAVLKEQWAKEYNQLGSHFEAALQTLDSLQDMAIRAAAKGDEDTELQAINQIKSIQDQRNKLLGLYPTPGKNDDPPPSGPITLKIDIIGAGNSSLIVTPEQPAVESPAEPEE